jgi:heme/copper-type cytochrome/quinol oxidase subunit 2
MAGAMEARRQANLRASQQKQAAEQRVLLIGTAAVVGVIVLVVAVSVLLTR